MGLYYYFYSPKTGKKIDEGKYVSMPFCDNKVEAYGCNCAIKWDKNYNNIEAWTIDKESDFYKNYYQNSYGYGWDDVIIYYTRNEIIEMQKIMKNNKTFLQELLDKNDLDGLIVQID